MSKAFSLGKLPFLSSSSSWDLSSLSFLHKTTTSSSNNNIIAYTATAVTSLVVVLVATNRELYKELYQQIYQRLLFPGVVPDAKYKKTHSLPPGEISGCPYFGSTSIFPDMNRWLSNQSHKVKRSPSSPSSSQSQSPLTIFKSYFFFRPAAIIVGTSRTRKILNKEFSDGGNTGISQPSNFMGNALEIFGKNSLTFETKNKSKYRFLRSLVAKSMTHDAVAESIPSLQAASEFVISEKILKSSKSVKKDGDSDGDNGDAPVPVPVEMEQHLKYMTLDVAWRQILGLELQSEEEIKEFHHHVAIWIGALQSSATFFYAIMPMALLKKTAVYKSREYLSNKILDKIQKLEEMGRSDGSTVGAMLFTRDDNDPNKRLTVEEVIDNALLLIVAGSETSASTLTNTMLLLGLHPDIYHSIVEEQQALLRKNEDATKLTKEMLDRDCPLLECTIKEVMRILPVAGGPFRQVKSTITIDGDDKDKDNNVQIPKNWWLMPSIYVTHENDPVTKIDSEGDDVNSHMDLIKGFNPRRWLDEKTRPVEYMPWGASYRFCAGHILAMAEMKTFLAVFCRMVPKFDLVNIDRADFDFDVDGTKKDIQWKFGAICTPKDGVSILIQ